MNDRWIYVSMKAMTDRYTCQIKAYERQIDIRIESKL